MKIQHTKLLTSTLLASGLILLTACGGSGSGNKNDHNNTTAPAPTGIVHNGVTYGTVTSPYTGRIWLDRNLGAARVCEGFNDTACYGDYYQWGRNADGHEDSMSATTTNKATSISNTGNTFVINHKDWVDIDDTGAARVNQWNKIDGTSLCPSGFRAPNFDELKAETINASTPVKNSTDAFNNFLKLPVAGYRVGSGQVGGIGGTGAFWTNSPTTYPSSRSIFILSKGYTLLVASRITGLSVRCIKAQ